MHRPFKILVVCSGNLDKVAPFISEQVKSLQDEEFTFEFFLIKGKGFLGYLKNLPGLRKKLKEGDYDLVHAHYGLSGLLAVFQRLTPVIVTYHGSDVHFIYNRIFSFIASRLSAHNILTHPRQINQLKLKENYSVCPCGVDTDLFNPMDKIECRNKFGYSKDDKLVLFSSSFNRKVKNASLALKAVSELNNVQLIELSGYTREEVVYLINASDVVLITSFYETGPLIVKEALACNTPVLSTDVGDVKELIADVSNCYIAEYDPADIAKKLDLILSDDRPINGRDVIEKYDLKRVAKTIKYIYHENL